MISVTLLSKNSEKHLQKILEVLSDFDEVLIYDNGSTDRTLEIAKRFANVVVHEGPFFGFGPTHNKASSLAKNDWIFSLDTDEVPTKELLKELAALQLKRGRVYSVPRSNVYRGRTIKGCGWSPDRVIRLYNRLDTKFTEVQVHERVISQGLQEIPLKGPLLHYSYESVHDFLTKMQAYSDLFAKENAGKIPSSPCKAILHAVFAFFKSYFLKRGFLDGYPGFLISVYNSHTALYKYLKLYENNSETHE